MTDEWIKMWCVCVYVCVCVCVMGYYSVIKRNGIGLFVEMWMDLESVITGLSKSEKNKYILTHICGS